MEVALGLALRERSVQVGWQPRVVRTMCRTTGTGETRRKCLTAGQGGLPGGGDMAVKTQSWQKEWLWDV